MRKQKSLSNINLSPTQTHTQKKKERKKENLIIISLQRSGHSELGGALNYNFSIEKQVAGTSLVVRG